MASLQAFYSTPLESPQYAQAVLNGLKLVDGTGSGLDANLLEGYASNDFLKSNSAVVYVTDSTVSASPNQVYLLGVGVTVVNLPAGQNGDRVTLVDHDSQFDLVNVSVLPNGTDTIANNSGLLFNTKNAAAEFVYYSSNWSVMSVAL